MELVDLQKDLEPWGIAPFDQDFVGLPIRTFNILRASDEESSIAAIGHFLKAGIERNQRVCVVSFEHPLCLLPKFKSYGFYFDEDLLTERLVYLYYKPVFSFSLNFSTDYRQLLDELKRLSKGKVERIALFNSDVMFNLESHLLASSSAAGIISSFADYECVVLGCYQSASTEAYQHLHEVSMTILNSYMEIKTAMQEKDRSYELIIHRSPLYHDKQSALLYLTPGYGFDSPRIEIVKHG